MAPLLSKAGVSSDGSLCRILVSWLSRSRRGAAGSNSGITDDDDDHIVQVLHSKADSVDVMRLCELGGEDHILFGNVISSYVNFRGGPRHPEPLVENTTEDY